MSDGALEKLQNRLERERRARQEAESLLARKSLELYQSNRELAAALARLEHTVDERTQALVDLRTVAYLDSLTGLANRRLFNQRLAEAVLQAGQSGTGFAMLFIDADDFKRVNDVHGHASGDAVLRHIATCLLDSVREVDVVARVAGDEFAVLLPGLVSREAIARLATRVLRGVNEAIPLPGRNASVSISLSMGVAVFPEDGTEAEALCSSADLAMYRSKQAGKNRVSFCDELIQREHQRSQDLERDIARAMGAGEFVLHYQPVFRIREGMPRVHALEALLRWRHPRRGLLEAQDFIAFADDRAMTDAISNFVLGEAMRDCLPWLEEAGAPDWIAINVSARQLRSEGFTSLLTQVLQETQFPPTRLALDVGEAALLDSPERLRTLAGELAALGVRLYIDDFGCAHAALGPLRNLRIDGLKLAREFTRRVPGDAHAEAAIEGIAGLARRLDIDLVAEGVETRDQLAFLSSSGCHDFQGYLFGPPQSAAGVPALLNSGRMMGSTATVGPVSA